MFFKIKFILITILILISNVSLSNENIAYVDMDLIMNLCNPIIVMSYGSKLAEGNAKSIRSNTAVVDAYLGN